MCALRVAKDGGGRAEVGRLTTAAKLVYRAYLGCLAIPGKTLVHEVFHTIPGAFPGSDLALAAGANAALSGMGAAGLLVTAAVDLVAFFARLKKTTHCKTGCGQEKMSAWWFAKVLARTAFLPVSIDPVVIRPSGGSVPYPNPTAVMTASSVTYASPLTFNSLCGKATPAASTSSSSSSGAPARVPVAQASTFVSWPDEPGGSVPLYWYRTTTGSFPGVRLSLKITPNFPFGYRAEGGPTRVAVQETLAEFQRGCAADSGIVRVVRP
jgi:hypothetical protein